MDVESQYTNTMSRSVLLLRSVCPCLGDFKTNSKVKFTQLYKLLGTRTDVN